MADRPAQAPDLRVPAEHDRTGIRRGEPFTFWFGEARVVAHPGETIAAALMAAGQRELRRTRIDGRPRGLFCAIGSCFDCLVSIDGGGPTRACLTLAQPDHHVEAAHAY
jgi:hypothetical protein